MSRFSIKTLFLLIAVVAVVLWFTDSGFRKVFSETADGYGTFEVFAKKGEDPDWILLTLSYVPANPSIDTEPITIRVKNTKINQLEFESVVDQKTGLWCVYDLADKGLVFLAVKPEGFTKNSRGFGSFWHPGIHIGWGRGFWARRYTELKTNQQQIPYERLPSEKRLAGTKPVSAQSR